MTGAAVRLAAFLALLLLAFPALASTVPIGPPSLPASQEAALPSKYAPGIWEFVPPAPWIPKWRPAIRDHALTYPPKEPQAITPTAFNFKIGNHKAIVILAEFSDVKHSSANTPTRISNYVNANGSADRSMRTFFYENSFGNYTLTGDVTGWVTLPNTMGYYAGAGWFYLVSDAAKAADATTDFSQYDEDSDGYVDNLIIVHAGNDQAVSGNRNDIWSHSGTGNAVRVDGKLAIAYCTVAETSPLGTYVHEFGHLSFDLPDLYDTYYNNAGVGEWDVMAAGAWGGGGWAPSHFSAWSKIDLGWWTPTVPTVNLDAAYTIYASSDTLRANPVKVETNYTNEYFLLEFRSRAASTRYDTNLPVSGLVIYHVDSSTIQQKRGSNTVETTTSHKGIDVEEVGTQDMDQAYWNSGSANDVWVSSPTGFTPSSTPNTNLYVNSNQYQTGVRVYNISSVLGGVAPHMTFSLDLGRINYGLSGSVLGAADREVVPGTSTTFTVRFATLSSGGDSLSLTLQGAGATYGTLDRTTLTLPPFGSATANLTVSIPVGWAAGDPAYVDVIGTSMSQPTIFALVPTLTRAAQVYSVEATPLTFEFRAIPDQVYRQDITVRNVGNGQDNVSVSAIYDPAQIVVYVLAQPYLMARSTSVAVPVDLKVQPTVLVDTVIPITFDVRYGPPSSARHIYLFANLTADRLGRLSIETPVMPVPNIEPGVGRLINITLHNEGNYVTAVSFTAFAPSGTAVNFDVASMTISPFSSARIGVFILPGADVRAWTGGAVTVNATNELVTASGTLPFMVIQRWVVSMTGDSASSSAPGQRVFYNLAVANLGNGDDNVTLTVSPMLPDWEPTLSLTNASLRHNGATPTADFQLTVTVPRDAAGNLLQEFVVQAASERLGVTASFSVVTLVLPVYAFNVTIDAAQNAITGSESATYLLNFRNLGNVRDSYSVTVADLPEGWRYEFAEGGITTVSPNRTAQITLILTPPPNARGGTYDFQIFTQSEGDIAQRKILLQSITLTPRREIRVTATPVAGEVWPGALITVNIIVHNLGNVEERVVLTGIGPFASVTFDPFQVTVGAYQESVTSALVVLKGDQSPGYAPLVIQAFSISNESVAAEQTVDINVARPPPQSNPLPGLEAALILGAAAAAVALTALARRRKL